MKRFGSYLGLWETELFSIPLLLSFSSLFAFIGSASEQGQFKYLQRAQFCLCLFPWLHSHICPQPAEHPAVCLVLLLLPAERSGLGLDQCQAVCAGWSAPHSQLGHPSLYPDHVLLKNMSMMKGQQKWHFIKALNHGQRFNYFYLCDRLCDSQRSYVCLIFSKIAGKAINGFQRKFQEILIKS